MNHNNDHKCSGLCCQYFTLPMSPDELWEAYYRWLSRKRQARGSVAPEMGPPRGEDRERGFRLTASKNYQDIFLIAPMVIYLGKMNKPPYEEQVPDWETRPEDSYHVYTCKHFDTEAKLCTIYEFRPAMCRGYPYQTGCNYKGCTHPRTREVVDQRNKVLKLKAEAKGTLEHLKLKAGDEYAKELDKIVEQQRRDSDE